MEGLWTILGPILTIILALLSKNVILSLFFGICYFSLGLYGADFLNHIVEFFVGGVNNNGFILVIFNAPRCAFGLYAGRRWLQSFCELG